MNQSTQPPVELLQTPDYNEIKKQFIKELKLAEKGKDSSLLFKTPLPDAPLFPKG